MATKPLPSPLAQSAGVVGAGDGDGAAYGTTPASAYGGYGSYAGTRGATGEYGSSPAPTSYQGNATAGYGSAYGGSPSSQGQASAYGSSATASYGVVTPAYGQSYSGASAASYPQSRTTSNHGQTLANWQPALPVSPWSTYERPSVSGVSGETVTLLKSDLKAIKRSRLKAWFYLVVVIGLAITAGYFELQSREDLAAGARKAKEDLVRVELAKRDLLQRMGVSEAAAKAAAAKAEAEAAATGPVITPTGPNAQATGGADTQKLLEDLKRQLASAPQISIEARGDRVVVALEQSALFTGAETDVGLAGYRTLYKFGKALKGVKDRRVVVAVPAAEGKRGRGWSLAASRSVSLGRFLVEDLGFEAARVTVSTGAPVALSRGQRGTSRIEFALDPIPVTPRS